VEPDPDRDERGQRYPLEWRTPVAVPSRGEPLSDEGEAEVAGGDPEQDQPGPLEAARKARLEVERLGERIEREEAE